MNRRGALEKSKRDLGRWSGIAVSIVMCGLAGCQSGPGEAPRELEVVTYRRNLEEKYCPVSLILSGPEQTTEAFITELRATGMFDDVRLNDPLMPVFLQVSLERGKTRGQGEFGKEMLSAVSLFVVPVDYTFVTEMRVVVGVRGTKVGEYSFVQPIKTTAFLFSDPFAQERKVAKALVAQLLKKMQEDGVFEQKVPAALNGAHPGS